MGFAVKLRTLAALGPGNVAAVARYRLALRLGLHPVQRIAARAPAGPFFLGSAAPPVQRVDVPRQLALFGWRNVALSGPPPAWNAHLISGVEAAGNDQPWYRLGDFDPALGDIKLIWELSRFGWAPALAQAARQGDGAALSTLNAWLADWLRVNPPYRGRQWKCGQEASFRVINLWLASFLLGGGQAAALGALVALHLRRIAPTMAYARAQDNNHGTSEAAALFMGGLMLGKDGLAFADQGRRALEERVAHLFNERGGFSQYSMVYHRLALDTLSLAEVARRAHGAPAFSAALQGRMAAAAQWLHGRMTAAGDAPNFGANDGAALLGFLGAAFRDFRPSLNLALALWQGTGTDGGTAVLDWLGLSAPQKQIPAPVSSHDEQGGTVVLRRGEAMAFLHYPRFCFRPGQADLLHLDFWIGGLNLLRDGGSYSYNTDAATYDYFSGVQSHNTVQFDGREPMPRLGRFLFGGWPRAEVVQALTETEGQLRFAVAYEDAGGCRHCRALVLQAGRLGVTDDVAGFAQVAVLRWRLAPGEWQLEQEHGRAMVKGNVAGLAVRLSLTAADGFSAVSLEQGLESRHYAEKTDLPVLTASMHRPGRIETVVEWAA